MTSELIESLRGEILDTPEPISADTDLFAAGLDSMAIMQLLLVIEDRFGVALDPADLSRENFQTPAKIAALIQSRR